MERGKVNAPRGIGRNITLFIICLAVTYAVAFMGSIFTSSGIESGWYDAVRPSLAPPNWVFPVVWNVLFFLIACSLYLAWKESNDIEKNNIVVIFGVNFLANILWSFFYFGLGNPLLGLIDLIVILFSIIVMIVITRRISRASSYLLWPYLIWVAFAGVLNGLSI